MICIYVYNVSLVKLTTFNQIQVNLKSLKLRTQTIYFDSEKGEDQ